MMRASLTTAPSALALAAALVLAPAPGRAEIGPQAGVSAAVRGEVLLAEASPGAVGKAIGNGNPVNLGQRVNAGANSGMQLMLLDQTTVTLGENAELVVDEFVYDPANGQGKLAVDLTKGAFRLVTGGVSDIDPANTEIRTPTATIGVRGTIVLARVTPQGSLIALGGPGPNTDTRDRVGAVQVSTKSGTVAITRPGFATFVAPGQAPEPPRALSPEEAAGILGDFAATGKSESGEGGEGQTQQGQQDQQQQDQQGGQQDGGQQQEGGQQQAQQDGGQQEGGQPPPPGGQQQAGGDPGGALSPGMGAQLADLSGANQAQGGAQVAAFSQQTQSLDTAARQGNQSTQNAQFGGGGSALPPPPPPPPPPLPVVEPPPPVFYCCRTISQLPSTGSISWTQQNTPIYTIANLEAQNYLVSGRYDFRATMNMDTRTFVAEYSNIRLPGQSIAMRTSFAADLAAFGPDSFPWFYTPSEGLALLDRAGNPTGARAFGEVVAAGSRDINTEELGPSTLHILAINTSGSDGPTEYLAIGIATGGPPTTPVVSPVSVKVRGGKDRRRS